ncbi:MAG: glutamyl-tRNA reductase, partial [Syntrophomonadaceae bacterium]|nr:glutamyl-tRNA reductase [Syntrophomonadaceae bacterium]
SQLKEAFAFAQQSGATNGILNQLFQKAVVVGKKVRTRTAIDQHPVSISYIAVELARELLGDMSNKTVLVVGAGETGELATRHLKAGGIKTVRVTNRSYDKAVALAENFGGRVVRFDDMPQELAYADIVISCTAASHYVICGDACRQALVERRGKDIVFIDIAVPRDVDPDFSCIDGVHIYDIDRLQNVSDKSYEARRLAAEQAREIIARELEEFNTWLNQLSVTPVLGALTQKGESIRQQELRRAMNRLGQVSEREERVISDMGHAIVNQLLRSPIHMIKEMALCEQGHTFAEMVKKLFELELAMEEHNEYADT